MTPPHRPDHEHGISLEAALDFLNTRELESGQLVDHLHRPEDAARWFAEQGALHPDDTVDWSGDDLIRVRAVRDALREVVDAVFQRRQPAGGAVELVNGTLAGGATPRVEVDGSSVKIGHRHGPSWVGDALASLAAPIVAELATGRPDRFRTCANDTCRWTFYDASPTGRRRWCDMKTCGNRAKAARHRAKVAQGEHSTTA